MGNEEQQEKLLREWLDCCVTEGGVLVALQKSSRRRNHPLVTQMVEKWLDGYRQIRPCASLSDGEEEEDDEDEWQNWSGGWGGSPWGAGLLPPPLSCSFSFLFLFSFPDTDKLWKPSGEDWEPQAPTHLAPPVRRHCYYTSTRRHSDIHFKHIQHFTQTSLRLTDSTAAQHRFWKKIKVYRRKWPFDFF